MNWKALHCLVAVGLMAVSAFGAGGQDISPSADPHQFRNDLHIDREHRAEAVAASLPAIIPEVDQSAAKSAAFDGDVLLSESVSPANFIQEDADIADLSGGRMAAVWADDRQGPVGVYIQLLNDDGTAVGNNLALIVGADFDLSDPHVCADASGDFYVVWREEVHGFLQAARFDSLATLVTPAFFVSDTTLGGYAGEFDAACLSDGRLVVAWEDYSLENNIVCRAFSVGGAVSIDQTTVNSDGLDVRHWSPAVAGAPDGNFAVIWEDYRSGEADVFYRRFNTLGIPYSAEISLVDASASDSAQYLPSLIYSSTAGYVAAWVDLRDGQDIYMQQVDQSGSLVGVNRLLSDETASSSNWGIALGVTPAGRTIASWTVYDPDNRIMLQRFTTNLQKDGSSVGVSTAGKINYDPAVTGNVADNAGIAWTGAAQGRLNVYGAVFTVGPSAVRTEFQLNDDAVGAPSFGPDVIAFGRFDWAIVFTDMRRDGGDIMLQDLYVGGDLVGGNHRVNGDAPGGLQSQPAAAAANDKMLVSWTDSRPVGAGGQNIFCRFLRPTDDLSGEITVNDDGSSGAAHFASNCAINNSTISFIVWTDTRGGIPKIYGQRFDQSFAKTGANLLIGPVDVAETGESAVVSADSTGDFIIAYLNRLNAAGPAVEFKKVTAVGQKSDLFDFVSDVANTDIDAFDAGVTADGRIILAWRGLNAGAADLYVTVFDYAGAIQTPTFAITDAAEAMPGAPDLSVDNHDYSLITWMDHRSSPPTPYRQIFDPSMNPVEANIPTPAVAGRFMQQPAVAGYRGRGLFAWVDARADGLNIYASQTLYDPTDVDTEQAMTPSSFDLAQNYPNPFNPRTTIQFSLSESGRVVIEVFNLVGQKVCTLLDNTLTAGNHQVTWDGTDDAGHQVASGVYLYRMKSGDNIRSRKMTLLK
jgi:hypothetical protein